MSENYDVGTRAWQPDPTEGWVASEVVKKTVDGNKVTLIFDCDNGEVRSSQQLPPQIPAYTAFLFFGFCASRLSVRFKMLTCVTLLTDQDRGGLPRGPSVRRP